jgi:hypothetical protein
LQAADTRAGTAERQLVSQPQVELEESRPARAVSFTVEIDSDRFRSLALVAAGRQRLLEAAVAIGIGGRIGQRERRS